MRTEESDQVQLISSVRAIKKVILVESPRTRKVSLKSETVTQLVLTFRKITHFAQSQVQALLRQNGQCPPLLYELEVTPITTTDRSRQSHCSSIVGSPAKRLRKYLFKIEVVNLKLEDQSHLYSCQNSIVKPVISLLLHDIEYTIKLQKRSTLVCLQYWGM